MTVTRSVIYFLLALALAGCRPAAAGQPSPQVEAEPTETLFTVSLLPSATPKTLPTITPTPTPETHLCPQPNQAADAVRAVLDQPGLSLDYWGSENSIYNHKKRLLILEDPEMTRYKIDCESGLVVEIGRTTGYDVAAGQKTAGELEQAARELILRGAPGLDLEQLKPVPGIKGDVSWFRWEGAAVLPDPPGGIKAFVQVGFAPDGSLVNYTNLFPLVP